MRIHLHDESECAMCASALSPCSYLCSEPRDTCLDRFFHSAALFESQYLYAQVDVITVAVVENCFPAVLLDVQVFLAWGASMHATIFFHVCVICARRTKEFGFFVVLVLFPHWWARAGTFQWKHEHFIQSQNGHVQSSDAEVHEKWQREKRV